MSSNRREFIQTSMAAGMLATTSPFSSSQNQAINKPNVLLIMTDTQRLDDMGAYGNPVIKTPHLDSLANGGVKFNHCYTQYPACMPARACVFTGRYPMANGVWSNGVPLPKDEVTLAHVFAQNGYRTGGAGKFHFLPHYPYRKNPLPTMETHPEPFYGFNEFHLGEDGRSGEHWQWMRDHYPEYVDKPDHEIPVELHNSYWSASHTIDFIKSSVKANEPFFAFCSFVDPHQGYNPPPPYGDMYKEEDMPTPIRKEGELDNSRFKSLAEGRMKKYNERVLYHRTQHYGEMTLIDDSVGRIIETLEELNIRDNTLIVFVSDHGDMLGDHWLWWKGSYHYPGCTNVPFFVNWPAQLRRGKVIDGFVQQIDIMPTMLDLAGIESPPGVQGRSLKDVLSSQTQETGYEFAYMESVNSGAWHPDFARGRNQPSHPVDTLTIRNHKWRITFYTEVLNGELYDLENDPHEFENRWDDSTLQDVKNQLMLELLNRVASTRDPLPQRIKPY